MRCENNFCIYWLDGSCTVDEISLDAFGNCNECIYVDISEVVLKKERKKYLIIATRETSRKDKKRTYPKG